MVFEVLSFSSQINFGDSRRYLLSYLVRPDSPIKAVNVNNAIYLQSDFVSDNSGRGKIQAYVNLYDSLIGEEYFHALNLPEGVIGFASCHDSRGNEPIKLFYEIQLPHEIFIGIEKQCLISLPEIFTFDVELEDGTSFIDDWIKGGDSNRFPNLKITNFLYRNKFK